jgi:peptidoglycan/LPS O-acetylase OafA/YrhL
MLHPELIRWINEFHVGVSMFFVLSGFLLAYTYGQSPLSSRKSYGKYMVGRAARILPLYWLVLTAYYLDPKFGKLNFSFLTYSLLHGFSNTWNLKGIAQSWSLSVEMTFYALLPLMAWQLNKNWKMLLVYLGLLTAVSMSIGYLWFLYNGNPLQFFRPVKFVLGSTFSGRWLEFLVGMVLATQLLYHDDVGIFKWKYKTMVGTLALFGLLYAIGQFQPDVFHHGSDHWIGYLMQWLLVPLAIALMIAGLIDERTWLQRFLSTRLMVLLGNASFAFYLIHISYVNIRLRMWWLGPDRNFVLLWLISIVLYLLVEKPIYDFIRGKMKQLK